MLRVNPESMPPAHGTAPVLPDGETVPPDQGMRLRILATSDLHMHLLPYDYLANRPCDRVGLARTAALIETRRAEVAACLLLDNGDFLQGAPMGEMVARDRQGPDTHPAIAAMNALGYDAVALGNHDFNFGLPFLRRSLSGAQFPALAANLSMRRGPDFPRFALLERQLTDTTGRSHTLRIGIVGFLPPQTEEWDHDLRPFMQTRDIVETARELVPRLRERGADLIVALAHSGIGPPDPRPRMEHAALALAGLPGIDVVIAGHTHEVFPAPQWQGRPGIDVQQGTLAGKPAVMPGFGGSHLGVIDLDFRLGPKEALQLAGFRVACQPVAANTTAAPALVRSLNATHQLTLRQLGRRIGRSLAPLCSHFSVIGYDSGLQLVNQAQRWHVRQRLAGTRLAGLPVLSASAPYRAGGRGGPHHYTDIAAGRLTLRHLSSLYAFPNRLSAICITGEQLRDWLERSASLFNRISPGSCDAPLLNPNFPAYNFDVVDGVSWQIDLSRPPRFHPDGRIAHPGSWRILKLCRHSEPVKDDDRFVLATNSYRLASCGLFGSMISPDQIVLERDDLSLDILRRYVRRRRSIPLPTPPAWRFHPLPGTTALFETAPAALDRPLPEALSLQPAGLTLDGFARMRLFL
ncbi:bifunctional 2',3'-cyclic-nucleotide 2'-phosphodiesterase/3'-nucleotidase [Paracoccus sp. (in: a-proteobacteria)]|uniref:bifunctional 2',3'-cyclic-nucleotide 2'-phosphodiesterase/3'-nucleotidase n=1 Tax=Paracoccus sp. TaxID=267 RepID=UPI00396C81C3